MSSSKLLNISFIDSPVQERTINPQAKLIAHLQIARKVLLVSMTMLPSVCGLLSGSLIVHDRHALDLCCASCLYAFNILCAVLLEKADLPDLNLLASLKNECSLKCLSRGKRGWKKPETTCWELLIVFWTIMSFMIPANMQGASTSPFLECFAYERYETWVDWPVICNPAIYLQSEHGIRQNWQGSFDKNF